MQEYEDIKLNKKYILKMIRNIIIFILLIIFTFWFLFKGKDINELISVVRSSNKIYIIISIFLAFCFYLIESINIRRILIALKEKKFSIIRAFKYTSIGAFFSAITPAAVGGQPVEIYYMSKEGVEPHNGTLALLIQLCGFQISTIALSLICAILNPHLLNGKIIWFYILGITINGIILTFMLLGLFSHTAIRTIIDFIAKIMKLLKVKKADTKIKKIEKAFNKYTTSASLIKNNKKIFIYGILRVFVQILVFHSIPFFIYKSFGLNGFNFFEIFSTQAVLYTTTSGIPLPGAIGASESFFLNLYGKIFGPTLLGGAMLLYRFSSFYLFIFIFMIIVIISFITIKNTNKHKTKKEQFN